MTQSHDYHVFAAVTTAGTTHVLKALTQSVDIMINTAAQVVHYIGLSDHQINHETEDIKTD
jgi:hypothetical protein